MKFGKKSIGAITAGLSLVMALAPAVPAFAEGEERVTLSENSPVISKTLQGNEGSAVDDTTFTFDVKKNTTLTVGGLAVETDGPDGFTSTVTVGKTAEQESNEATSTALFAGNEFTHAGTYAYNVTEQGTDTENLDYNVGDKSYIVVVIVANNTDGTEGVHVAGYAVYPGDTTAVAAQVKDKDGNVTDYGTAKLEGLDFTNTYVEKTNDEGNQKPLTITKTVTGDQGNKKQDFNFTVTFTAPKYVTKKADGTDWTVADITVNGETGKVAADGTVSFMLKSGDSATFDNIVVGTTYTVSETEAGADGYDTTLKATYNGSTDTEETLTQTAKTSKSELVSDQTNKSDVTNHKDGSVVTGVIVNNAPFIVMIGAAAAGVVAYGSAKRKLEK